MRSFGVVEVHPFRGAFFRFEAITNFRIFPLQGNSGAVANYQKDAEHNPKIKSLDNDV